MFRSWSIEDGEIMPQNYLRESEKKRIVDKSLPLFQGIAAEQVALAAFVVPAYDAHVARHIDRIKVIVVVGLHLQHIIVGLPVHREGRIMREHIVYPAGRGKGALVVEQFTDGG